MLPAILPGDTLVVEQTKTSCAVPGDIVLFRRHERLFAHRVIGQQHRNGVTCIVTSGDSLAESDPPVFRHELLGRVTSILREGRYISPHLTLVHRLISLIL